VAAILWAVAGSVASAGAQTMAGTWTEVSRSTDVSIESWGDDCPTAPRASSSRPNTAVEISVSGDALVFPRGRRSDQCWSDNPAVRLVRYSKQGNRYVVECRTPPEDSKQEHGVYTITAEIARITVELVSNYDWVLREDRCRATLTERRVLERAVPAGADAGTAAPPDAGADDAGVEDAAAEDAAAPDDAGAADDGAFPRVDSSLREATVRVDPPRRCASPGRPVRLRLRAVRTVRPGDRAPIAAHQIDADGCDLGSVDAVFEILGAPRGCRVTGGGTFEACSAVAECDGETIRVVARFGALEGRADIRVSAEIEAGLGTVTPVWADEPEDAAAGPAGGASVATSLLGRPLPADGPLPAEGAEGEGEPTAGSGSRRRPAAADEPETPSGDENAWILWAVVGGGGLIVLVIVVYLVLRSRRPAPVDDTDERPAIRTSAAGPTVPAPVRPPEPSGPSPFPAAAPSVAAPLPAAAAAPAAAPVVPAKPIWYCPGCRKEFPEPGHCPQDGLQRVAGPVPAPARTVTHLACPGCGRGYPAAGAAKFCPEDRELLMPYGMGMVEFRTRHRNEPAVPARTCPRCGARTAGDARFCPNDGEKLR
jgi:hypothetical protein